MYDILLIAIPIGRTDTRPLPAIFHLKSYLELHGKTVKCIECHNLTDGGNPELFDRMYEAIEPEKDNAPWIGISLLTDYQVSLGLEVVRRLNLDPNRIIWGGPGTSLINEKLQRKEIDAVDNFKHVIYGEGEIALLEFLNGNLEYPGINSDPVQIDDLNSLPPPDYGDINVPMIALTGSRGCVRKCKFCNVPSIWKKYRYVDGTILAENAISVIQKNPYTSHIAFSDSLINGSEREFRKMCTRLKEHNLSEDVKSGKLSPVTWEAQYIARRVTVDHYQLVVDSGCTMLKIGIESGSERLRNEMAKKFNDEAMYNTLFGFLKTDPHIKLVLMIVVGYPQETEEDFEKTLDFMDRLSYYNTRIKMSPTLMSIIPGTPVATEHPELIENIESHNFKDYTFVNENGDIRSRVKRLIKMETMIKYHKYCYDISIATRKDYFLFDVLKELDVDYMDIYKEAIDDLISSGRLPDDIEDIYENELPWPEFLW